MSEELREQAMVALLMRDTVKLQTITQQLFQRGEISPATYATIMAYLTGGRIDAKKEAELMKLIAG